LKSVKFADREVLQASAVDSHVHFGAASVPFPHPVVGPSCFAHSGGIACGYSLNVKKKVLEFGVWAVKKLKHI
jgi:hypothetical protein